MHLTATLFRHAQNELKVPLKPMLSVSLKNRVSSRTSLGKERGCLHEMTMLLTCLQENNFEDKKCTQQFNVMQQCYTNYQEKMEQIHKVQEQVVPVPNSKTHTHKQLTYLLRKYPTI